MINITINDMLNSQNVFREIANMPIKMRTSFAIARIIRNLETELETFEKTRQELIQMYGEKNDDGSLKINEDGNIIIASENIEKYNKEIQDLLNEEITIAAEPLRIEDMEYIELTPTQAYMIEKFIKE